MKVSVVIPNYNGINFIEICLDSLRKQNYKDFETIVIDNCSEDGSDKLIEEKYEEIRLVRMDKNYGFSIAVNKGIKLSETEFVLLLNNDTEVHKDFVGELVKCIEKSEDIFSCSSKMISFKDRGIMDDAGDLYAICGWAFQRGIGQKINNYTKEHDVFASCAGAAIYRRKIFDEIGMFDVRHFAYLEDIDVGYRARINGYRNVYCPKAIVYHMGSATSGSRYNPFKVKLSARNNIYLIYKNTPVWQFIINFPFLLAGFGMKLLIFKKMGFGKDYIEGLKEGIRTCYKCKKVEYKEENLKNYIKIEKEMLLSFIIYAHDYIKRRI